MSIAVANREKKDARKAIHTLVDNVRDKGFSIPKDFILKTFLHLHSSDIKFNVTNFSKANAIQFEQEWDQISNSILSVFDLIRTFGFTDATLTSKNALLPIIYYLYHQKIYGDFHKRVTFEEDRIIIKKWLHTALIKRIFGGSSDNPLNQIRRAFTSDIAKKAIEVKFKKFPSEIINSNIKGYVGVTDEFIDEMLTTQKDGIYAFSILALLYPNLDYRNNSFHKDHLHPAAMFEKLDAALRSKYEWKGYDSLLNLQMLDANENESKNAKDLDSWVKKQTEGQDRGEFLARHLIPDVDLRLTNFEEFMIKRSEMLREKLKSQLS